MATTTKQTLTSLLTEHFRYTPLTLLDDIINTINELVYRAVTAVEEGLSAAPAESLGFADRALAEKRVPEKDAEDGSNLYPESRAEIEHGVHQLETLLEASVDKNFDKLEIFVLRSILNVPEEFAPWIRLAHYENLDFTAPSTNISPESLYLLRRKLYESRKLNHQLTTEKHRNTKLIAELRALLRPPQDASQADESLAFLTSSNPALRTLSADYKVPKDSILSTAAQNSISQLPALRQLINELRPQAGKLSAPRAGNAAEERRSHIESETRRILERDGVDLESGRGSQAAAGARAQIGAEEVRGIEAVAELLGARDEGENEMRQ